MSTYEPAGSLMSPMQIETVVPHVRAGHCQNQWGVTLPTRLCPDSALPLPSTFRVGPVQPLAGSVGSSCIQSPPPVKCRQLSEFNLQLVPLCLACDDVPSLRLPSRPKSTLELMLSSLAVQL